MVEWVDLAVVAGMAGVCPGQCVQVLFCVSGAELDVGADLDPATAVHRVADEHSGAGVGEQVKALAALQRGVDQDVAAFSDTPDGLGLRGPTGQVSGKSCHQRCAKQVQVVGGQGSILPAADRHGQPWRGRLGARRWQPGRVGPAEARPAA